ncbi:MAG: SDR family oxidoreductase [archaeon]|jgi:UDP-glucose 4-epimerase
MEHEKILILGASGFLGKAVIDECKRQKIPFTACNQTGKNGFTKVDITKKILLKENYQIVIHLAAKNHAEKNPKLEYYEVNTLGTINVLNYCVQNNVKKLIFSSSCSVYGKELEGLINEDYKCSKLSEYGKSKSLAEQAIRKYSKDYNLDYVIFRFPIIFGKNNDSLVSRIISKYDENNLCFSGLFNFGIVYVKDAAKLILEGISSGHGAYNSISITTNIEKIVKLLNEINHQEKQFNFEGIPNKKLLFSSKKVNNEFDLVTSPLKDAIEKII